MNDHIALRGIRAFGRHGAEPGEREREQPFDIALELEADFGPARASDDLNATIDYAAVHRLVVHAVAGTSFALLERLADEILTRLLHDARINAARITIAKPGILAGATPSVTLSARRRAVP
jgi:dihydroneopterin aldolase